MASSSNTTALSALKNGIPAKNGLDAKLAATYEHGFVITTPNATYIPRPPSGMRDVHLRSDLRYGMDDATLWPQFYLETYPFLAAIRRRPELDNDDLAVMWWTPTPSNFVHSSNAGIHGLGLMEGREMDELEKRKAEIFGDVRDYLEGKRSDFIGAMYKIAVASWVRLHVEPGRYEEKCLEVTEFQRNWLELFAAYEWETIYTRRIVFDTNPGRRADRRVGCFTTKHMIAQDMFSAGIPVWYIRPLESIGGRINVEEVGVMVDPQTDLRLDKRPNTEYPTIFRGPAEHPDRYIKQHKFTRSRIVFADPVSGKKIKNPTIHQQSTLSAASYPRSMASLMVEESVDRKKRRSSPYDASQRPKAVNSSNSGRDKFVEVDLPNFPGIIPVWNTALQNVRNVVDENLRAKVEFEGYGVPDPGLFSTTNQRKKFLENWLRTRVAWLWRITRVSDTGDIRYLPTKVWRDLLCHGLPDRQMLDEQQTSSSSKPSNTSADKRMRRFASVKDALFGETDGLELVSGVQEVKWKGEVLQMENDQLKIGEDVEREVLWELYEINFRCDLLAVDSKLAAAKWGALDQDGGPDALDRSLDIYRCFHGGEEAEFTFLPPKLPDGNVGLAGEKFHISLPYNLALARIIVDWDIPVATIIPEVLEAAKNGPINELKAYRFTRAVVDAFCAGVYRVLGRAAVTPHRFRK